MQLKRYYRAAIRETIRPLFGFFEWLGVHVTPIHFYQPIPDTKTLPESLWTRKRPMRGIEMYEEEQLDLLETFARLYKSEYDTFPKADTGVPGSFYLNNGSFESVDAEVYYAMLRYQQPKRVIEIGSGNSTLVAALALRKNAETNKNPCDYTIIDPYPRPVVKNELASDVHIIERGIEDVDLSVFDALGENDILFIDSSHVVRIGGDVVYEYLEILPRLKPGVLVHAHDIFLPLEYPKPLVERDRWFWSEQYLLQAFLAFNKSFEVVCANSFLSTSHPEEMARTFGSYKLGLMPGSFWFRRV